MERNARRQQVLECAAAAFAERGYHRTSVSDIVGRAGVARATFYQYFHDKRSIFAELLDGFIADLQERIAPIDPTVGAQRGLELVRQNVRTVLSYMLERRALSKILLSGTLGVDPDLDQKLVAFYDRVQTLLERSLSHAQRMGVVRPCDIHLAATLTLGGLKELLYQVTTRGYEPEIDALVEAFLPYICDGLLTR